MQQTILEYLKEQFHLSFTQQQLQAIETIDGPVLLLAVPGAGKTTVMVSRIASMIYEHGIAPSSILTITFSKAGARDMRRRYEGLFGQLEKETPLFCTIHSFCYQVVGSYCQATGGVAPQLIEARERSMALREIYQRINQEFLSEDLEEELVSNLSFIKNAMLRQEDVEQNEKQPAENRVLETQVKNLWSIYKAYNNFKRDNGLMDFDDMLSYTLTILKKYPQILEYYQDRYPYLCVDEAQDTSKLQHAVIGLLAQKSQNLFLVGDEDQSIYRFRGACPENLLEFPKQYPKAKLLKMEENFRSTGEIVEHANRFISFNKQRYPKNMFTHNERGGPIEVKKLHDFADQYHAAIEAYLAEPGTTAFIYRNNLSAVPIADILDRNDVDFYIKEHKARLKNNYVYFDRMVTLCDENQNTGKIRYISMMVEQLHKMEPVKAMECILYQIGYLGYLEFTSGAGYSMQAQKLNILMSLASRVSTVEQFLDRIDELDEIVVQHAQRPQARLTLTTAHSAKGLEFDTVVLLDCMDDIFPAHSAVEKWKLGMEEEMEEEARLFYVACTRARKRLVLPYANFSANTPAVPSRFLSRLMEPEQKEEEQAKADGIRLYPGLMIEHKNFGRGQVVSVNRERGTFTAFFGKNGTRTLTIQILKTDTVRPLASQKAGKR